MSYLDKLAEIKVKLKFLGCAVSKPNDVKLFLKSQKFMIYTIFQSAASSESKLLATETLHLGDLTGLLQAWWNKAWDKF